MTEKIMPFIGKPLPRYGMSKKEYMKKYYEKNKEDIKEFCREYRLNNIETIRENQRMYYLNKKEKLKNT